MTAASLPYYWYLAYLSQPAADRSLYQALEAGKVRTILEIGMGDMVRTQRMLEVALRHRPAGELAYYGIDLFEDRPGRDGRPLKQAYAQLRTTGVRSRLIPGDPHGALSRTANEIRGVDLVVIAADHDQESLARAWKYLERMLAPEGAIYHQETAGDASEFKLLGLGKINRLAEAVKPATPVRRAA